MKKELDDKLCADYPKIFVHRNGDRRKHRIACGFEIKDGWYNIVNRLCYIIQQHVDQTNQRRIWVLERQARHEAAKAGNWEPMRLYHSRLEANSWRPEPETDDQWQARLEREVNDPVIVDLPNELKQVEVTLIKEKFGGLRFHAYGGDEFVLGAICFAESMSYSVCDVCGQTGKVGNQSLTYDQPKEDGVGGYYATRCREHWGYREG